VKKLLDGVEQHADRAPNERAIEAGILQIMTDIRLYERSHMCDIPRLHLPGNEERNCRLLSLYKSTKYDHHSGVNFTAQEIIVTQLRGD